jgi:hypothetical protein
MNLTNRQHKAVAINLDNRKVMMFDATGANKRIIGSSDFIVDYPYSREQGKARIAISTRRYGLMMHNCSLGRVTSSRSVDQRNGQGDWFYLSANCVCVTFEERLSDYVEFAQYANAPVINESDRCAILVIDSNAGTSEVHTVKAVQVSESGCYFEEENEAETMPSILAALRR